MVEAESIEVRLNYYALVISIIGDCMPETAFEKVQSEKPSKVRNRITNDDIEDMAKLRAQGLTLKDLGEIYGIDPTVICRRLKMLTEQGA